LIRKPALCIAINGVFYTSILYIIMVLKCEFCFIWYILWFPQRLSLKKLPQIRMPLVILWTTLWNWLHSLQYSFFFLYFFSAGVEYQWSCYWNNLFLSPPPPLKILQEILHAKIILKRKNKLLVQKGELNEWKGNTYFNNVKENTQILSCSKLSALFLFTYFYTDMLNVKYSVTNARNLFLR
jgi:hypothetical protein